MTAPEPAPERSARLWHVLLGVAVSALLLYLSLRHVQLREVYQHVRAARLPPLLLASLLALLPFVLRIFRWQLLLRRDDGTSFPPTPLWHAIAMGFMANNVLPLRMGEIVRTYAASRLTGARFSTVLASIAVERLFDALAVIGLLALGVFTADLPAGATTGIGAGEIVTGAGLAALSGLVLAGLVVAFPLAAERVVRRIIPGRKLAQKLVGLIEGMRQGLLVLRSPGRIAGTIAWSLAIWGVSALSFYVGFSAFGIQVDFSGALLMQGLLMFGIALPSTPGYVGAFELPIIASLALYGVPGSLSAAYALTFHVTNFAPITLLGAWSLFRTKLGLTELRRDPV